MKLVLGREWLEDAEEDKEEEKEEGEDRFRNRRKFISQLEDALVSERRGLSGDQDVQLDRCSSRFRGLDARADLGWASW